MAKVKKILTMEELVNRNLEQFTKDSTETYPAFQESTPVFVTYYNKSAYASDADVNFENFNQAVGIESPNLFYEIASLPLYEMTTADFSTEETDSGRKSNITGTCTIIPGTVTPSVEDQFLFDYHSQKYLFAITSIEPDNFNNKKYYRISYQLSPNTLDEIKAQVYKEMVVDYNLIGRTESALIERKYSDYLNIIKSVFDEFRKSYRYSYYDENQSCFANKRTEVIDQFINYFASNNDFLPAFEDYRNTLTIHNKIIDDVSRQQYKLSPFFDFEKRRDPASIVSVFIEPVDRTPYKFAFFYKTKYNFTRYVKYTDEDVQIPTAEELAGMTAEEQLSVMDSIVKGKYTLIPELLEPINSNDSYNLQFIKKYIAFSSLRKTQDYKSQLIECLDMVEDLEEYFCDALYIKSANDSDKKEYDSNYYIGMIVLFVLKDLYSFITNS
jgi:hypothetical protein